MLKLALLVFVFSSLTLTGCSVNPRAYDDSHSKAYNLAHAGGLIIDIKDTRVPANEIGSITESMQDASWVGLGYLRPQLGLTSWGTAGFNLIGNLLEPDTHGERSSLFAWMPLSEAASEEEALPVFLSHVKDSTTKALEGMGVKVSSIYETDGAFFLRITKDEWSCPEKAGLDDSCYVETYIFEPYTFGVSDFVAGAKERTEGEEFEERYTFTSSHKRKFHKLHVVSSEKHKVPENEVYKAISKELPEWTYLYLAPKKVKNQEGELINYPYILNQGKAEFFVIPKD